VGKGGLQAISLAAQMKGSGVWEGGEAEKEKTKQDSKTDRYRERKSNRGRRGGTRKGVNTLLEGGDGQGSRVEACNGEGGLNRLAEQKRCAVQ